MAVITELDRRIAKIADERIVVERGGGGGGGPPSGPAGGVLSGSYPNPGFAADMATQAELDAFAGALSAHDHDGRYFTEAEIAALLAGKQDAGSYAAAAHGHAIAEVTGLTAALVAKADDSDLAALQALSQKGAANGYAGLDAQGKVPAGQLPPSGGGVSWSDFFTPMGWHGAANLTAVTVFVTNTTYLLYLGQAQAAYVSANVRCRVATAAAGAVTWAEVGIFTGTPPAFGAGGSLTRRGFLSIAGQVTAGLKDYAITGLTGINPGDDIWVAVGGQHATTQFQLRAGLADDLQSGAVQQFAGRLSTAATPVATSVSAATLAVPMVRVRFA